MPVFVVSSITEACRRWSARRTFLRRSADARDLADRLVWVTAPAERAELLAGLADSVTVLAVVQPVAFGQDQSVTEVLAARADLYRLVAACERVLADPQDSQRERELEGQLQDVPPAEAWVWRDLARRCDRAGHAELLAHLADMAAGRLGTQAAQPLNDLAATEHDRAAGRFPVGAAQSMPRWGIAALFSIVGAMIALPTVRGFDAWSPAAQAAPFLVGLSLLAAVGGLIWWHRQRAVAGHAGLATALRTLYGVHADLVHRDLDVIDRPCTPPAGGDTVPIRHLE